MGYDFTKKTALQRKTREVGIISMVEDLAGEELRTTLNAKVYKQEMLRLYELGELVDPNSDPDHAENQIDWSDRSLPKTYTRCKNSM